MTAPTPPKNDWVDKDTPGYSAPSWSVGASAQNNIAANINYLLAQNAGKQPLDADLTAIAAINGVDDDVIQRKSGSWVRRTIAQFKVDLAITLNSLLPTQTGQAGKYLSTDGTNAAWGTPAGGGSGDPSSATHAAASKTTPVDADELPLIDSAASFGLKRLTWANLKAAIKAYYDPLTATLTNKTISGSTNTLSNIPNASVTGLGPLATLTPTGTPTASTYLSGTGVYSTPAGGGGSGDVVGPASATDNAVARYDTTTGKLLQTSLASVDDSGNVSALNAFLGIQSQATTGTTVVLTVASPRIQERTGTTAQTDRLPTTNVPQGAEWEFRNSTSVTLTVQSSGANTVLAMPAGYRAIFRALVATPTTAANWLVLHILPVPGTSGNVATSNGTVWASAAPPTGTLPSQTGHSGEYLTTNGTTAAWGAVSGGSSSMPNVVDHYGANPDYPANSASSGNAFRNAAAAGGAIRVPAGSYLFDGAPLTTDNLIFHGDGPGQTTINISAGNRLWDKTDLFDCLEVAGIKFLDGAGAIRSTYADTTVAGYRTIENCRFERFTVCAVGHRNTDSPYWSIRDCAFGARFATDDGSTALPAASAGTIGLALSGLVDTVNIEDCDFYCYQVGVKLGLVGANAHIKGGNFLRYADYTTFPRTDVWLPPWPENPYATGIDAGNGFTITETKFGNEGKDNADFCVLYADEAAAGTGFEAKLPSYTASTGYVVGHTIDRVVHSCNATGEVPLVHSTTPNIFGCTIGPVFQSGAVDVPLLRILNATGIDTDYWGGNIVGPVLNGLNNQFTPASEADYVTAVTGTIPFQPQNARNSRVNSYRGTGARQLIPETKLNTATGSTNTFTLPQVLTLAKYKGVEFIFKNEGSGLLTITGATNSIWAAAQVTSYTIAAGAGGRLICDGTHWVTF